MTDAPDDSELADALGVDAGKLRSFVREHPGPEAEHVLAWADTAADGDRTPSPGDDEQEGLYGGVERWLRACDLLDGPTPTPVRDAFGSFTDGGTDDRTDDTAAADVEPGAVVVDREADPSARDEAIVVNTPPVHADEWEVGTETVAEYNGNERYPDDDLVACVVYRQAFGVTDRDPDDVDAPIPLRELDVRYYTFPRSRLRVVEARQGSAEADHGNAAEDDADDEGEPTGDGEEDPGNGVRRAQDTPADAPADLAAIAAAVRARNVDDVTLDQDAGVVRVEKLGLAYTVRRDGTVLDRGAFADALEDVATRALDDGAEDEDEEVVA